MKRSSVSDKMATLSAIWEAYAQLIRRRNDRSSEHRQKQRTLVLDKFLGLFIMISLEDKEDNIIGEMRNIGNELSQEFMRNVESVTRNLREEEATCFLEDYMLRGRGWRLLYTVDRVGIKGVSQRQDLCEVLLNLLPYCLHMKPSSPSDDISSDLGRVNTGNDGSGEPNLQKLQEWLNEKYNSERPLSSCFHLVSKLSKLKPLGCPSLQMRKIRRVESSSSRMNAMKKDKWKDRKVKRRFTRNTPSKKNLLKKFSDSDEEEKANSSEIATQRIDDRKSSQPRFKRGLKSHIWSTYTKDEDSETDDEFVGVMVHVDDTDMTITAYHLVQILIRLLLSLGELDMNQNVRGRTLSATILPSLLYFLSQFRLDSSKSNEINRVTKGGKQIHPNHQDASRDHLKDLLSENHEYMHPEKLANGAAKDGKASAVNVQAVEDRDADEDVDAVPWQGHQRTVLLKQVIRAVLSLSGVVATQQNGVRVLMHLKVVDSLLDLKILHSLIPDSHERDLNLTSYSDRSVNQIFSSEVSVAMDTVCGTMQLLQAIYTSLPFNPSNINDANLLTSKLTRPDIVCWINQLIEYSEQRMYWLEKSPGTCDNLEQDLVTSIDSSRDDSQDFGDAEAPVDLSSQTLTASNIGQEDLKCSCDKHAEKPSGCSCNSKEKSINLLDNEMLSTQEDQKIEDSKSQLICDPSDKQTSGYHHSAADSHKDKHNASRLECSMTSHTHDMTADPIRCIGDLITTLKSIKVNYIHSMKCLKRRHRNCEYGMYHDHHHDILGIPHYTATKPNPYHHNDADYEQSPSASAGPKPLPLESLSLPLTCVVSELSTILLDYITEAKFKASRIHLLSTLRSVGVCCCLQPESIISAIVPQLPIFSQAVRNYALDTLTSILLDHFQGAQESRDVTKPGASPTSKRWEKSKQDYSSFSHDTSRCVHCYLEGSSPLLAGLPTTMDSGFSSCDIEEMRRQKLLERWKSIRLLQKIIISRDESLALTCAKHLMTLAVRGNSELKEELFFGVYLHVLFMKVRMPRRFSEVSTRSFVGSRLLDKAKLMAMNQERINLDKTMASVLKSNLISDVRNSTAPASLINSQESLFDSPFVSGSPTPTEISSADDLYSDGSIPSPVMLLCVSALPYVLQVDKVMSIFLARKGLANLTKLLEYEQLRAPVMSVFEALVMIDERRLRDLSSDHRSVYEGGGVIQTFIDTLAKRTCTVTAKLQQISLQKSRERDLSPPAALQEDEFLKFYQASVIDEGSCVPTENSQTNEKIPSDAKSVDSCTEEKKSPSCKFSDSCTEDKKPSSCKFVETSSDLQAPNSMIDSLPVLLDMWKTCAKLCMNSRMFRAYYRESPCLYVVQETLILALSLLGELSENRRYSVDTIDYFAPSNLGSSAVLSSNTAEGSSTCLYRSTSFESCGISRSHSIDLAAAVDTLEDDEDDDESNFLFSHEAKLEFIEAVMMVCFSCHTISPSQKRGNEDELWLRLKEALQSCIHLEASKLAAVFHMLLNVALPRCPSILEYSFSQIVSMLNLREREDIADEDEVQKLIQHGFEDNGDADFTEHGYEGDTECSVSFDWKKGLEYSLENQAVSTSSLFPWPCFPAVFRLFVELMIACHRIASRGVILHTVSLRLLQTLRSSKRAVRAFCSEHLLEVLVNGFRDVLVHCPSSGKQSTLQEIILSLVQVVAQSEISASELRQFLQMFQDNTETSNSLLSTLLAVIEKSKVCPNYSAAFPVKHISSVESSDVSGNKENSTSEQAVWHHTAVELHIPGISWPPSPAGFTVTVWVCVDDYQLSGKREGDERSGKQRGNSRQHMSSEDSEKMLPVGHRMSVADCLLLFAVGNKEKMFEIWLHPKTASVYCRLTTGLHELGILKDCTFQHLLTPDTWHLLTVTYYESLDGSTFMGKLSIILDGWKKHTAIMDHPAWMRRKQSQYPSLCIGDARHGAAKSHTGSWKLGTLRVFRDVGLSDDLWFHLYCLGPNCEGLSKCDCGDLKACYIPAVQKDMAGVMNLTWDVLVGVSQLSDLDAARAAQVLVYKISHPEQFSVFTLPHAPVDSTHGDLGLVPSSGSVSDLLTQKPVVLPARLRGQVKIREVNTLEKAIEQAGGIEAFLFLVAKIFEDSMKAVKSGGSLEVAEHLQSKATHILFRLVHQFPSLAQAFIDANGYAMLAKVLTSSKSIVGYQMLKVLMDACTTESVFKVSQNSPHPVLLNNPEAIIRNTEILNQLLLQWRVWHKAGEEVTAMLFRALEALSSSRHLHSSFNLKQMQAGDVMNKIFSIYLERIQDGQPSLSVKVSQSASKVIRGLLGSPPDLHLLMAVMDFLLLVHPAASGFISFTPSSFYFRLWWDGGRSRASSSSQRKPQGDLKHNINELTKQTESTDSESRTVSEQESSSSDPKFQLKPSKRNKTMSNGRATDSQEDEGGYKYPPLEATTPGLDHNHDMETDHGETDSGSPFQKRHELKSDIAVPPPKSQPAKGTHNIATSSGDSVRNFNANEIPTENITKQNTEREDKTINDILIAGDAEHKASENKQQIMYISSTSDKQSDLDDGSVTLLDNNMKPNGGDAGESTSQEEESRKSGGVNLERRGFKLETSTDPEEEADKGLTVLCVSLIEYLTQIIQEFPEASLDNVFSKVVNPKSMLVLAKNSSSEMRLAVMKLLGAYLAKAPSNLIDAFIKMDGFYLLANQLRSFPVNSQHVETAVSILLGQQFAFDNNFMVDDLGELPMVQQSAAVLLLSLLDGTATDPYLCRNSLALLSQLLEANSTMSTLLLDMGLAETMCNLATNIQKRHIGKPTPSEEDLNKSLLVDVQLVLCSAAVREFGWTGPSHFQNMEDMFSLLKALEDHEINRDSEASRKRAGTARAFQISLVVKILEYVEKRSEELVMPAHMGWMTSFSASTSAYNISHKPTGRHSTSSNSFSSSSPKSSCLRTDAGSLPPCPLPVANLLKMHRTTFSSPDIIGFLAETSSDSHLAPHSQIDGDSSGSFRPQHSPRTDGGNKPSRLGSLFSRKRKMIYASVTQSDLLDRFRKILVTAVDMAVMFPREEQMRPLEQRTLNFLTETRTACLEDRYLKHLFLTLYRFYEHSLVKEQNVKKFKNPTMHGAKDVLKTQLTRLLLCIMSLKVHFDLRTYALAFIMTEPQGKDAIKTLITDKQVGIELSFYLYNLLSSWRDWLNPTDREHGFALMLILRNAGVTVSSPDQMLTQGQVNALMEDKKQIDIRYRKELAMWLQKREVATVRITNKFEPVRRRVAEQAMTVTQDVTRLQVEERKKLVAHIKQTMTSQIQLKKQWQELVQCLTHERAVWHQKASYPQSWKLDPTEGPGRVRKRLQRCHLGIDKKFLLPDQQPKLDAEKVDPPLIFLFEDDHQMSDSAALIYRLYTNEKIQHTCKCTVVSPASESKGELLVGEVCIFFVADGAITVANYTQMLLGNLDQLSITWPHTDIRELQKRWYQLQDVGLEIFLISGRTCLLAFQTTQDRDQLYNILRSSLELPNLIVGESLQAVQHAWLEGDVTNYDYLMYLNKRAGRSYTDLMQYPVFPFILKNYSGSSLNMNHSQEFRNLKKPIAIQDKTREKRYKDNYEFLCQEANRPHSEDEMVRVAPFHYGSHYSNSGTVLYYMVRLPPFTKMFLSYQDSSFDIPDRTFHSLGTSWRLSSFESSTDVKELIPEFFFLPEFFINSEGFDFGQRQNGERVNHVSLPPWCENNPRLFVLIHRQALESTYVTRHLHLWLDLVFGYKQQGEEAVKAINVFHPSTYFGVDASGIKDHVKRQALLTMIRTYGQTPKQLFRNPHPPNQLRSPAAEAREKQKLYMLKPVPTVTGLKWGQYVGSLDLAPPVSMEIARIPSIKKLVALHTGIIFGVERYANILSLHGKQRDLAVKSFDVMWAGVVTWGYHDNIIRIRSYQDKPLINFLPQHSFGKISYVESVPDCRLLFVAGSAGTIIVYSMTHNSSKPSNLQVRGMKKTLYGHTGPITTLCVCQEFSILVSGSSDGTCIIWDLNRLTYVRSIKSHCAEVTTLTVSCTLGDIASVSHLDRDSSSLQLHTINAAHIATQEVPEIIHCLGYSCAPEGRSVNVIAGGLGSGVIRLWSSWDLTPVRDLVRNTPPYSPIISLSFSADSQYLMSVSSDGSITLWDKDKNSRRSHVDKFIPVISSGDGEI